MTSAAPSGRRRRVALALAVVAVLAVVGGLLWLLPGSSAPEPSAATSATGTTTATTVPTTTAAPTTTEPIVSTTTPAPTTTPPPTSVPVPVPVPTTEPAPAPVPPPVVAADPGVEGQVLALVDAERTAAGCGPVTADEGLAGVARAHSADMRDRGYFSHTSPEGLSPFDRAAAAGVGGSRAENIAMGQSDAAAVMAAWMASPGHRANILDCSLTRLGVGVAEGPGGPWWTQLFGS